MKDVKLEEIERFILFEGVLTQSVTTLIFSIIHTALFMYT